MLAQYFCNGIIAGSAYSLIAIGYTMIYGVGRFINFAHGEVYMVSAYAFFACYILLDYSAWVSAVLAGVCAIALALLLERIAYRPFRNAPRLVPVVTTLGASTILKAVLALLFGIQSRSLLKGESFQAPWNVSGILFTPSQLFTLICSVGLMLALAAVLKGTRVGKSLRAVADDAQAARYVGIDTIRVTSMTFAIGGFLAGVAGILVGYDQNIQPHMGLLAGFKGFTAAVLGGIGSIPGACLGGFVLGIAEHIGAGYLPSIYRESISFAILILILLARPQGIFGEK